MHAEVILMNSHKNMCELKINESRYSRLFVLSGSVKNLVSIDFVNIYIFSIFFFNRFCTVEKFGVTPNCLYRDSLTLISTCFDTNRMRISNFKENDES